ncbi:hypothetical protein AAHE18_04G039500 [Arachis hypogaea]
MSLQLSCKTASFNLNPFPSPIRAATSHQQCSPSMAVRGSYCINSNSDFSRRGQHKKGSSSRVKGLASKGFIPKSPIGRSNKNRYGNGGNNSRAKGDSLAPIVSDKDISGDDNRQRLNGNIDAEEAGEGEVGIFQSGETVKGTNSDNHDEISEETVNEEASGLLKLELEANSGKQEIERIAEENLSQGTKVK